jgi:predicted hotdog family 3-hydroxylacyl-ACP dehydratase
MISLPLSKPALFAYTPHQGFMLFIDRLEEYSIESVSLRSTVAVTETSMLYDPETGLVPIWAGFEYMAQSIGLLAGLNAVEHGDKPNIGFIMGIRNFQAFSPGFRPGDNVEVNVRQIFRDGDVAVFEGKALVDGREAACGVINTISAGKDLIERMKEDTKFAKKDEGHEGRKKEG